MNKRVKSNSIRIIAGRWRGRKLEVIDAEGLRPTTDRVRETLFNWLMHELPGARCLDLFAGTGALGFESLSRGAEFVQFVELEPRACKAIAHSLRQFEVLESQAQVATNRAESFLLKTPEKPFDVVFLDPPFAQNLLPKLIDLLVQSAWLSDRALIYIEQPSTADSVGVPAEWELHRNGRAGQSQYGLYSITAR